MTQNSDFSFRIPQNLKRYPFKKQDPLQAWDSADELLLQHLTELNELPNPLPNPSPNSLPNLFKDKKILIVNDSFGALSSALEGLNISTYTDSYVSAQGIQINSQNRIQPINQLNELNGPYDLIFIRIPKNMSFFEDILCHLSQHLHSQSQVICAYMVKHQSKSSFDLLNRMIGETRTTLARKKARLIFASFQRLPIASPYPLQIEIEAFKKPFVHHSNLFSREKLDIGTRFLLNQIPKGNYRTILDLGCANGIIGIAAKMKNPAAQIIFSDDSQMAIQSARINYESYFQDSGIFHWINCFEKQPPESVDLVLCNPPFHQGNTLGTHISWQMFTDAHRALIPGGTLRVIGNSHLHYHVTLKKIFGNSQIVATNSKFMIVDAIK
jgi:16S rRNA G1207 methylase RsmC